MGNLMKRHLIDVLQLTVYHHHAVAVSLSDTHVTSREVGNKHTKGNRYEQQRLILLHDTQIEQREGEKIHDYEERILRNVGECGHVIYFL